MDVLNTTSGLFHSKLYHYCKFQIIDKGRRMKNGDVLIPGLQGYPDPRKNKRSCICCGNSLTDAEIKNKKITCNTCYDRPMKCHTCGQDMIQAPHPIRIAGGWHTPAWYCASCEQKRQKLRDEENAKKLREEEFTYNGKPVPRNLRDLPHKRRNLFEVIISWLMSSHVCQICKRKEIWSVNSWFQIDHLVCKDKYGCSVICNNCRDRNADIFGPTPKFMRTGRM